MPALAVYIGVHDVTALLYKSPEEYYYYSFPYVYNRAVFANSYTETDFYKNVLETFCKESNTKLADCDVLVTGFLEPHYLDMPLKFFVSLYQLFQNITEHYPILVNNYGIATPAGVFSQKTVKPILHKMKDMLEEQAFLANISLYPNVVVSDLVSRLDLDYYLFSSLPKNYAATLPSKDIVFMGSRFNNLYSLKELNYLFMFNLLAKPGIYKIGVDAANSLLLIQLLKLYLGKDTVVPPKYVQLGTLVSAVTGLECMVNSQVGTSQIVELDKNKLFFVPVDPGEKAKILLKLFGGTTREETVEGGTLGLIFDTRDKKGDIADDFKTFNAALKSLGGVA